MPQPRVAIDPNTINLWFFFFFFLLNDASGECITTHLFSFATASSCLPLRDMKHFINNDSKGKSSQVQGYKENWAIPL